MTPNEIGLLVFSWTIAIVILLYMLAAPAYLLYNFVKEKTVRAYVMRALENDDGGPDKSDAKDAVMLFFAYLSSTVAVATLLKWMLTGNNNWELEAAAGTLAASLFGISKWNSKQ